MLESTNNSQCKKINELHKELKFIKEEKGIIDKSKIITTVNLDHENQKEIDILKKEIKNQKVRISELNNENTKLKDDLANIMATLGQRNLNLLKTFEKQLNEDMTIQQKKQYFRKGTVSLTKIFPNQKICSDLSFARIYFPHKEKKYLKLQNMPDIGIETKFQKLLEYLSYTKNYKELFSELIL